MEQLVQYHIQSPTKSFQQSEHETSGANWEENGSVVVESKFKGTNADESKTSVATDVSEHKYSEINTKYLDETPSGSGQNGTEHVSTLEPQKEENLYEEIQEDSSSEASPVRKPTRDGSQTLVKSNSESSIHREVRELRKEIARQIEAEKHIDLDHFELEELLTEQQLHRDSLDDHLYHIACFPKLVEPESSYSCEDVPTLKEFTTQYNQSEPMIDGEIETTFVANLDPRKSDVESSFAQSTLEKCEVTLEFQQNVPIKGEVESALEVGDLERKEVESFYRKNEVSYLRNIENILKHEPCDYHAIASEYLKNEVLFAGNYKSTFQKNECKSFLIDRELQMKQCSLPKGKFTYSRFDGFKSVPDRSSKLSNNLPRFKGRPISWSFENNLPQLCEIKPLFLKSDVRVTDKIESHFEQNLSLVKHIDEQFICTNEGQMDTKEEPVFDYNPAQFDFPEGQESMQIKENLVRKTDVDVILDDGKIEVVEVETEFDFNEPVLISNEDAE